MDTLSGKAHKIGNRVHVNDIIAPKYHAVYGKSELRQHAFQSTDAGLIDSIHEGGILLAGENFGYGSVREEAALAIKHIGVEAVIAKSFASTFFRNAINVGLPVFENSDLLDDTDTGDCIHIRVSEKTIINERLEKEYPVTPVPDFVHQLIEKGGITQYMHQLASQTG
jgi:3-isopropylmalate/(R)-2-methylmalate dehydratase small subunit